MIPEFEMARMCAVHSLNHTGPPPILDDALTLLLAAENSPAADPDPEPNRTKVVVRDHGNAVPDYVVVDEVEAAVAAINTPPTLFQRADRIVNVVENEEGGPTLHTADPFELRYHISRAVDFVRLSAPKDQGGSEAESDAGSQTVCTSVEPPYSVVKQIHGRRSPAVFPHLRGLIGVPAFTAEGVLMEEEGYDPESRNLVRFARDLVYSPIAAEPSREDALAALETLLYPFQDVPFADEASRANFIGALLTFGVKPLLGEVGLVPIFLISSPDPSTGKTWISNALGLIGNGARPPKRGTPHTDEEWQKTLMAAALGGSRYLMFDNHSGHIAGRDLDRVATAGVVAGRILGRSEEVVISFSPITVVNGNNIEPARDTVRRVVYIRLRADSAFLAKREAARAGDFANGFAVRDAETYIDKNRGILLGAMLTIIRAWILAGRPPAKGSRLDSFESFSDVVGALMAFVGVKGFLGNLDEMRALTIDERASEAQFLEDVALWMAAKGARFFDAGMLAQAVRDGYEGRNGGRSTGASLNERELSAACQGLLGNLPSRAADALKEPLNRRLSQALGYFLRDMRDADLPCRWALRQLPASPNHRGARRYELVPKEDDPRPVPDSTDPKAPLFPPN